MSTITKEDYLEAETQLRDLVGHKRFDRTRRSSVEFVSEKCAAVYDCDGTLLGTFVKDARGIWCWLEDVSAR